MVLSRPLALLHLPIESIGPACLHSRQTLIGYDMRFGLAAFNYGSLHPVAI